MSNNTDSDPVESLEKSTTSNIDNLIPDFPPGPLDKYRKTSQFNWKLLRVTLEPPEYLTLKLNIWKALENEKEFHQPNITPTVEEQKRLCMQQLLKLHTIKYNFLTPAMLAGNYKKKTKYLMTINEALVMVNPNLSIKFALGVSLFANTLPRLGTDRHLKYIDKAWGGEVLGCFAITEIAHGSNTKNLRTTATYDPSSREFILHTPDFEAAKCWVGNLGRTATYAIVFAQLTTSDGEKHGLHAFLTPIRDPGTLLPYPGVTVGDMGEKNGLNGIDNGFMMFNKYRIPKENLLNRTGDISDEGSYQTSFTNPQQILGAILETLSTGRVGITQESTETLFCALTIAVRYAAVRKQFGPGEEEMAVLEYPLHQWRLFPYLAASVVFKIFITDFVSQYLTVVEDSLSPSIKHSDLGSIVGEIHAIVSSCKPLVSWVCRDALQECREACGGHGYLKASNLGNLKANHDASVTYEGDNNVLIQQTSNWLLRQGINRNSPKKLIFGTTTFLKDFDVILRDKFVGYKISDVVNEKFISRSFNWLLCWLIKETNHHLSSLQSQGIDKFTARAEVQLYKARTLSLVYAERNALTYTWNRITKPGIDPNVKKILEKLYLIYGLWCIDHHLVYFYQGGFSEGYHLTKLVRDGLISLCNQLLPNAISIVDAIAPPDFVLNSVIAYSNGNLYENLKKQLLLQPGAMDRATWWKDAIPSALSKL